MRHILICLLACVSVSFAGTGYHVTTTGTSGGAGTIGDPWSLARGIDVDATPHPVGGDTLWIHVGAYTTSTVWDVEISGTSHTNPVIVRNWNNERVQILNSNPNEWTMFLRGNYLWVWGLEIHNNLTVTLGEAAAVTMGGTGDRLINNFVHDAQTVGISSQQVAETHVYGNIVNYNGRFYWAPTGEGPGYGWYAQNIIGGRRKYFVDNIVAFNWSWGSHLYTQGGGLDSMILEGNAIYNSGLFWQYPSWGANSIYTAPVPNNRYLQENNNVFYLGLERSGGGNYMGLYSNPEFTFGFSNATITGNYFIAPANALTVENDFGSNTITTNVFIGPTSGIVSAYPSNTFLSSWPSTRPDDIIVRKNAYEPNRANIYVLNYNESATVSVNPNANGTVLNPGDTYVIKDALNYYGANVASGTWTSGSITIPMTGLPTPLTPQLPPAGMGQYTMGWLPANGGPGGPPPHTAPRFATFILIGGGTGGAPEPTINVSVTSLAAFSLTLPNPSAEQSFTVSGVNLIGNITETPPTDFELSLTSGSGFSASPIVLNQSGGIVPTTTIYARFNRPTAGTSSGNITHTSTGATTKNVAVTGTASAAANVITASTPVLSPFSSVTPNASAMQSYILAGTGLISDITVTAPTDFQVSRDGVNWSQSVNYTPSGGIVNNQPVYARMNRATAGSSSGNITNAATGATTKNIAVSGTAVDPPIPRPGRIPVRSRR